MMAATTDLHLPTDRRPWCTPRIERLASNHAENGYSAAKSDSPNYSTS